MFTIAPNRIALYGALNLAFVLVVGVTFAAGEAPNPRILYLISIFALCSTSLIDLDGLNGRYALLGIFLLTYFVMFGVGDLSALAAGNTTDSSKAFLSTTEAVILVGATVAILSYRAVVSLSATIGQPIKYRDWSMRSILLIGSSMWLIGTYATYNWYVHIVTDITNEAFQKGIQSRSTLVISAYILAEMMQPFGILLIAYAWRTFRLKILLAVILSMVAVQVVLGFIVDIKGMAMMGGILVIVTIVLIDGRVPKLWLAGAIVYVIVIFPIFQAYRTEIHGTRGIARTDVVANFGKVLGLAIAATDRVNSGSERAQTFLERSSLRGSVQTIVEKTGHGVAYQEGHTLTPLLATFIPKIVWSDKPDVRTGQLVNKEFHLTDSEDIYISPSHLGELYWNFGWPGVVGGMAIIGSILGFVGGRFNLAAGSTVTRLLVTVVTIKQVVLSFEGAIAPSYVVWLRSLAGIVFLHMLLARWQGAPHRQIARTQPQEPSIPEVRSRRNKLFPNLLR